jgi:succinyl-diaminopimelate desuccinylase
MYNALTLTEALLAKASVTPLDMGCQDLLANELTPLGFECERMVFGTGAAQVHNLWAKFTAPALANGAPAPLLVFAGHTDVVPTGPVDAWDTDPFVPTHKDGKLFGRGASDMKASLAAMVVAVREFRAAAPQAPLSMAFLITSDEEGPAVHGTVEVCKALSARGERLDFCIVGEPTSIERTGDMIKNGRRGSMSGRLSVKGIQGHIAYPHLARNPIHQAAPALAELAACTWDEGNDFFPPTSWQVSNIHGGTGASNVIPGDVVIDFNFRFCTESTPEALQSRVRAILDAHQLEYDLTWSISGLPFLTTPGPLVHAVQHAIRMVAGIETQLSTTGGTSDGRFIANICPQVIELGPPNATIHKINEYVAVHDIEPLKDMYREVMLALAATPK